jgi:hypothetical protein
MQPISYMGNIVNYLCPVAKQLGTGHYLWKGGGELLNFFKKMRGELQLNLKEFA